MKKIYKFSWDCGRAGELDGLFIANSDDVDKIIGKPVSFGEALGKHSDVTGVVEIGDLEILSEDEEFIEKFEEIVGEGTISGFNPMDYIDAE